MYIEILGQTRQTILTADFRQLNIYGSKKGKNNNNNNKTAINRKFKVILNALLRFQI